jgi:hypothetical protein
VTILSCLALTAGIAACGSSTSSSSSATTSSSTTSSSTTASSSAAAASDGRCRQLLVSSSPTVRPGSAPDLKSLESKALSSTSAAFGFTGQTCVATSTPAQVITLTGEAQLHPNLVVDGHETIAGQALEVRFIGSKIYIYLAEIASRDGGKPWLRADLKRLSSASGLNFEQLLSEVRQLSPNGPSPLLKAASSFHAKGQATIDGQTVYVYEGSFAPSDLSKLGLPGQLGKQTAAKLKQLGATAEQVTTYVTSSAVALRTVVALYKGSSLLTASINSSRRLAHSISVSPPPANKTIDYSKVTG